MKTFKEFINEALKASVVGAAARQEYNRKSIQKTVNKSGNPRPILSQKTLYHGTTQSPSRNITRSGWRTDTNVTRQMQGSGVYTTPQRSAATMYANQRANQRGESPAIRTFKIPSSIFDRAKANREKTGNWTVDKGGRKFNVIQMTPQAANRFDVTNKPGRNAVDLQAPQRQELRQRVRTGLQRPANINQIKSQQRSARNLPRVRGGSSSLSNVGSGSGSPHLTKDGRFRMNVGHQPGDKYGISGIGLAD